MSNAAQQPEPTFGGPNYHPATYEELEAALRSILDVCTDEYSAPEGGSNITVSRDRVRFIAAGALRPRPALECTGCDEGEQDDPDHSGLCASCRLSA